MLLCYGWLQSAATSSSAKKVLNVPLRARLRAFFACILVAADFAHPRYEVHFCYALLVFSEDPASRFDRAESSYTR